MNWTTERHKKTSEYFFLAWLLTLPFGAKVFAVSLGFMTLYPNLILAVLFVALTFKSVLAWNRAMAVVVGFLFLWFAYAVGYEVVQGKTEMGMFHVRILGMQVLFSALLFNAFVTLGWDRCLKLLMRGVKIYLHLLILVGMVELFTGIHEAGTQTDKFMDLPVSQVFYAPMFLYDNQNEFICYLLFLVSMLNILDHRVRQSDYAILFYAAIILLFSYVAEARIGVVVTGMVIVVKALYLFFRYNWLKSRWGALAFVGGMLLLTMVRIPLFYGPKIMPYETFAVNREVLVQDSTGNYAFLPIKEVLTREEVKQIVADMHCGKTDGEYLGSETIRRNLLLNGLAFAKEKPLLGIGPGNFFERTESGKAPYPTGTVRSPHNFVVEAVAQYGLFGWIYLLMVGALFVGFVRRFIMNRAEGLVYVLLVFPVVAALWLVPSSFLYLDIHWLFLPTLICLYYVPEVFYFRNAGYAG